MIQLLPYDLEYDWLVRVDRYTAAFAVSGQAEHYGEQTSIRMRKLVTKLFTYPFYVTFEGDEEIRKEVLAEATIPVAYAPSGRTVLTQIGSKTFQAEVSRFTVCIEQEHALHETFQNYFNVATYNELWVVHQHDTITYENGFASITLGSDETILVAAHDAYGFTFITNVPNYCDKHALMLMLQPVFHESTRKDMIAALQQIVVPKLRAKGFTGSFPHFRNIQADKIELLTFQFDRYGGGFVVEAAVCPANGVAHVPRNKVTAHDVAKRLRLNEQYGQWFRYDVSIVEYVAQAVLCHLPEAEHYWQQTVILP